LDPRDQRDGYRFIYRRDGDSVRAFTLRRHDWADRVPQIAEALRSLRVISATIDDGRGVSDTCDVRHVSA